MESLWGNESLSRAGLSRGSYFYQEVEMYRSNHKLLLVLAPCALFLTILAWGATRSWAQDAPGIAASEDTPKNPSGDTDEGKENERAERGVGQTPGGSGTGSSGNQGGNKNGNRGEDHD